MNALPRLLGGIALATCAMAAPAGTRQASFDVVINLSLHPTSAAGPGSTCTSGAIADSAYATVGVVCSGREFVAIHTGRGTTTVPLVGPTQRFRLDGQQTPHPLTAHLGQSATVGEATVLRDINLQDLGSTLTIRVDF